MLVLTRKSGESIHIGDEITIKVSDISGNRVKLCIDAPKIMRILRAEVAAEMEQQVQVRDEKVASKGFDRRTTSKSRSTCTAK